MTKDEIVKNKSVLITGITGSGKSTVCIELKRRGYKAFDIEGIHGLFDMVDKETGKIVRNYTSNNFDEIKHFDWICDKRKLQKLMGKNKKGLVYYCGTGSNLHELVPLFDEVFLLKGSRKVISNRLANRPKGFGYDPEARKWIMSWKNWWENRMQKTGAIIINANGSLSEITNEIVKKSRSS